MQTPPSLPAWLRQEDLARWLLPLARSLALPFRLSGPEGQLFLAVGEPFGEARGTLLLAHQVPVALLEVPAEAAEAQGDALAATLAAYAEARVTVADMAKSLAASWKESNFIHHLALWLEDVVEVEAAAAVIVRQLARVLKADCASLHLRRRGEWTLAADFEERACAPPLPPRPETLPPGEPTVIPALAGCQVYLPLAAGEEPLGMLSLSGPESLGLATNLKFLTSVGAQVSHALRLRALIPIAVENAQIRSELSLAAELQRSLLPQSPPAFPGAAIAASCRTTQAVGGDGYDFLAHPDGLDLVVADVSGHGLASGLLMSSFLGMLRTQDRAHMRPAAIAERANDDVCQEVGAAGHYVTALYARLSSDGKRLAY
ncbi:MAG: PP2C family protein-serine/threonine phosphatase, partial [Candidatus Sericytochromatia bacterium]